VTGNGYVRDYCSGFGAFDGNLDVKDEPARYRRVGVFPDAGPIAQPRIQRDRR
jgi:hypothetical protein